MSVVSDNIAIITAQAATLDTLVADFRAAKAAIDAAETAIRKAQPLEGHETSWARPPRVLCSRAHGEAEH